MNPRSILQFLSGKKTYIVGGAGIVYAFGISKNWWPNDVTIWGALGSTGAMTLRAALAKTMKQFLDDLTTASATPASQNPAPAPDRS